MRMITGCVLYGLLAVLSLAPGRAWGQDRLANQLHVFLVVDSNADIGKFCVRDRDLLVSVLKEAFENAESEFQNRYRVTTIEGDEVVPEAILKRIKETEVGSDDAVLFYYTGHGAMDAQQGHYLATSGGQLLRTKVRAALLDKRPRMLALMTDSCSNQLDFTPGERQSPAKWRVIHDLFFAQTGLADIQSSQENVSSWCGTFTNAMAANLCVAPTALDANRDGVVAWDEYFTAVKRDTLSNFQRIRAASPADGKARKATPQEPHAFNLPSTPVRPVRILKLPAEDLQQTFTTVSASADGELLLTGDSLGRLRLWDAATGQELRVFEKPGQFSWSAALAADGRHAASNDLFHTGEGDDLKAENVTRVWDVATGKQLRRIPSSRHGTAVHFLDQERIVLADHPAGTFTIWNWQKDEAGPTFTLRRKNLGGFAPLGPGDKLRLLDNDPANSKSWVQTVTVGNEKESFQELPTSLRPFTSEWSPGGKFVALAASPRADSEGVLGTGRRDWQVELWECEGSKPERIKVFRGLRGDEPYLAFSPNNLYLALAFREQTGGNEDAPWAAYPLTTQLQIWDIARNRSVLRVDDLPPQNSHPRRPRGLAFVEGGRSIALAYGREVRIYKLPETEMSK